MSDWVSNNGQVRVEGDSIDITISGDLACDPLCLSLSPAQLKEVSAELIRLASPDDAEVYALAAALVVTADEVERG